MLDSSTICGLLAEPDRRTVLAALILGSSDLESIATTSGLDTRATMVGLTRLVDGGLVETDGTSWILLAEAFKMAARANAAAPAGDDFADEPAESARILAGAIVDGRLVRWPSKRSKRLVVLDHLAQRFEPGARYSERQVNAVLAAVSEDTATMRRYLVDERFLDRANGEYWRSGGTVDSSRPPDHVR